MRFPVIIADPPWEYRVYSRDTGHGRSAEAYYGTVPMATMETWGSAFRSIAAADCALFVWVCAPSMMEANTLVTSWGFAYKTVAFAWVKADQRNAPRLNLGHWTRSNLELVLLYTMGHPERHSKGVAQIVETVEPPVVRSRPGRHSAKPDAVQHRIEALMGDVPRLECFARRRLAGWVCVGNELDGLDITESLHRVATDAPLPRVEAAQAGLFEEIL